ncbi:MAG TPA: sigma 54-interacting transcriptional regulator, partial [Blastocatellia bacterium]|nr:sigma 54-interacting transcriptional regulator [Blastocatellia bacterium]
MNARPPDNETEREDLSHEVIESRRAEEILREIIEGTASVTGGDFFRSLVRHVASALRARYAFITECREDKTRARMLAFWNGDGFGENMEFDPRGTPCMNVLEGNFSYHPQDVQALFPEDRGLCELGVQSYLGLPLRNLAGQTIGHLAVLDHRPMEEEPRALPVLKVFAARAAAELDRLHAEDEIRALNERLRAAADRSRTLLEINNAIITNLTHEALLSAVCKAMERYIPFDKAGLTLYEADKDSFRFLALEAHSPVAKVSVGITFERAETCSGEAFDLQRPVLRRDLETERRYSSEDRILAEGIRSLCVVPLIVQGKSIGTFNVGSREKNQYQEADAEFLQEVANQIAIAVANSMAFEEITRLKSRLERENLYLQEEIRRTHDFEEIVGDSPALLETLDKVERVAPTDSTVLISGETGTGKEIIARTIHSRSARKDRPLVKVNCGAISAGLVESELFGHVKGAFTGALERRIGRFELADGGTLFLDEVGELPPDAQVKLLRVLQEGEFEPVGSSRTIRVDVRIIAATNRNLEQAVRDGRFRP